MQQTLAVAGAVSLPLIAMGGVATGAEAFEMLAAGATLVGVGTENFRDPGAGEGVRRELAQTLAKSGFASAAAVAATPSGAAAGS
jgi:dihydroorotate dehydrogenase (NAD+) catalytic subunit